MLLNRLFKVLGLSNLPFPPAVIPAGILQPPFFDHELPWSANYGAIGAIIGHELTHGFDSRGKNYDLYGKLKDWWTLSVEKKFNERAFCMAKQYNDITEPRTGEHLRGVQTLGENCADNGGIKVKLESSVKISFCFCLKLSTKRRETCLFFRFGKRTTIKTFLFTL